jgi:DivIVA domain-containing protein
MAMSFSRPDPASPAEIADAAFSTGRRGFDQNEVRDFLRMVSAELLQMQERARFLERELQDAQSNTDLSSARMDDETLTRMLGEETARVLNAARESSHEIREKAEQAAAQMLMEAGDEATRLREEAEIEASRRRADAANDAEAELSMAKQQGREMVNEARAYRERVLSELARRRELAREQIEQLVHGRDRLMQAFERARLVAVDVVAEMQPLGEPDEYVNLQPSTGPVPVMVARENMTPTVDVDGAVVEAVTVNETATVGDAASRPIFDGRAGADDIDDGIDADAGVEAATEIDTETDTNAGEPNDVVVDADAPDPDEGSFDDVVVDLFARLRGTNRDDADDLDGAEDGDDVHDAAVAEVSATDEASTADEPAESDDDADDAATIEVAADTDPDAAPEGAEVESEGAEAESEVAVEATPFDQRDADLTPLIVASARKLKRVLADEQNEVLDALRRNDPVRDLDALLPWTTHHAERYSAVLGDELHAASNAGAALTATNGRTPKLRKAAARQAVQQASDTLTRSLVGPLRDRLERCIAEGDGDNPAITKKVRAVYRECKTQHIDEQLDDVFRAAHGRGVLASVELGTPLDWTPDPGHDVCPDCDDNRLAGAVPAGQAFPTGHLCTPAHPGCRCLLVPAGR